MEIHRFEFNLFGENTYIIWDAASREAAIVDPGMADEREERILDSFISANALVPKAILLTHIHVDHAAGVSYAKSHYAIPVIAHEGDVPLGRIVPQQAEMFHFPIAVEAIIPDRLVNEGEVLTLGNEKVEALHAPGHSPGSLLFYIPSSAMLLSGDVLFRGSIGRTDLPGGSHARLLSSIHSKILTLPVQTVVYPGHGPSTTIADELRSNPFF